MSDFIHLAAPEWGVITGSDTLVVHSFRLTGEHGRSVRAVEQILATPGYDARAWGVVQAKAPVEPVGPPSAMTRAQLDEFAQERPDRVYLYGDLAAWPETASMRQWVRLESVVRTVRLESTPCMAAPW